jgi:hypothetical protein
MRHCQSLRLSSGAAAEQWGTSAASCLQRCGAAILELCCLQCCIYCAGTTPWLPACCWVALHASGVQSRLLQQAGQRWQRLASLASQAALPLPASTQGALRCTVFDLIARGAWRCGPRSACMATAAPCMWPAHVGGPRHTTVVCSAVQCSAVHMAHVSCGRCLVSWCSCCGKFSRSALAAGSKFYLQACCSAAWDAMACNTHQLVHRQTYHMSGDLSR